MHIFKTPSGLVGFDGHQYRALAGLHLDGLLSSAGARVRAEQAFAHGEVVEAPETLEAPLGTQEVWAAGVTYFRSRVARMAESEASGGGSFYDRVYEADRPELFFKAHPSRVAAPGARMHLRRDSRWMVPEPELTLVIDATGAVVGYTVGNDLSARDIEGENPLYLPQAKVWDGSAAVGPALYLSDRPLAPETEITLEILRGGQVVNADKTTLSQMRRRPDELARYLFSEMSFPVGCLMMTGTGIVPPDDFTLAPDDEVRIGIAPIGTLVNTMALAGR